VKKRSYGIFTLLLFVAAFFTGCASHRVNLLETGQVTVEFLPCKGICAFNVQAFQDGETMIVTGKVKRDASFSQTGAGHVDIMIIGPDGRLISSTGTKFSPRIIKRKGLRESQFSVRIPVVPPKGSVIRVAYKEI